MMSSVRLLHQGSRLARSTVLSKVAPRLFFSTSALKDSYDYVKVDKRENGVAVITLHRPKALNALCDALFEDLIHAATALDQDENTGCLVLTGSQKAFAAGADISEMKDRTFDYAYKKVNLYMTAGVSLLCTILFNF